MFTSKLASLEARIARLESSLKPQKKSASFKTATFEEIEYHENLLERIARNFPNKYYAVQIKPNGVNISGEDGDATVVINSTRLTIEMDDHSTGKHKKTYFQFHSLEDDLSNQREYEEQMNDLAEDSIYFIEDTFKVFRAYKEYDENNDY